MHAMSTPAASFIVTGTPSGPPFGSLFDLARMQRGAEAEICEACNTINIGHAQCCKSCARRLPSAASAAEVGTPAPGSGLKKASIRLDLYAFWAVVNSLVLVTTFVPLG